MKQNTNIKNITIEYYNTCTMVEINHNTNTYARAKTDINNLLQTLKDLSAKERTINYNGENLILSSIDYNQSINLWELVFFKSRSATIPFIINDEGASRKIKLKDDEMISEVLCAEYNPDTKVLAMQRNVYAVGTRRLEEFFSFFLHESLYLDSIQTLSEEKKKFFKKSKLKKLKIHIKKDKNSSKGITQYNKNTSICKAIDSALAVNSAIINIEFSVGNSSKAIELQDEDYDIFQDLMNNTNVKCLKLGLAPDEHSTMQITDFMDLRIRDLISIQFTKGNPINITDLLNKMTEKFKNNIYLG